MKLNDIQRFILDKVEAMKIISEKKILLSHKFEKFEYIYEKIMNDLRNIQIEYFFIDNGDNDFVKFKNKLMKMLLNDSLIKEQFIKHVREKRVEWNKNECKR